MTFDIAMTGITAASIELDVISNNIANNATTGFKKSNTMFSDLYPAALPGYAAVATGQGVKVSSIEQDFAQGDVTFTNNNLDLSIAGGGFFRVIDNDTPRYTRAGSFGLDRDGYMTNTAGERLTGYSTDANGQIMPILTELQFDYADIQPQSTASVQLNMNLDTSAEVLPAFDVNDPSTFNFSTSTTIYDSLGSSQIASIYFHKDADNSWTSFMYVDGVEVSQPGGDELNFTTDGSLANINGGAATSITTSTFSPASGATPMSFDIDLGEITQFGNPFGVNFLSQDGFSTGRLDNFDIDQNGTIFGRYSNGQAKTMGQVVLAQFANSQGLQQIGDASWIETFPSGEPVIGAPGSGNLGVLQSGSLEESNVDITEELVSMIGAQRSFQANAQVISTGDTLTQTIINIRR